jgi:hypothetical protein
MDEGSKKFGLTSHTGWRWSSNERAIAYHKAADIIKSNGDTMWADIAAPEDGWFYYLDTNSRPTWSIPFNSHVARNDPDGLQTEVPYQNKTYGFLLIFVTNKSRPEDGRVYVICHLGPTYDEHVPYSLQNLLDEYLGPRYTLKTNKTWGNNPPLCLRDAIEVKAGEWIGMAGRRGEGDAPHIHLEVFENFDHIKDIDDGATDKTRWRRVNPKSVFQEDEFWFYTQSSTTLNFPYFIKFRRLIDQEANAKQRKDNLFHQLPQDQMMYNDKYVLQYFHDEGIDFPGMLK